MGKDSETARAIIKAVRAKCLDCSGGEKKEVERCDLNKCPLYQYRLGNQTEYNKRPVAGAVGAR